ncbi:MAG: hypothetical protein IJ524_08945 [Bacteroidales bacterium]|nr:hypothetical protein [Bacteroidales bacterium]
MKRISLIGLMAFLLVGCIDHKGNINFTYEHSERYRVGDVTLQQPVNEIDVTWLGGEINIVYADIPGVRIHEEATNALIDSLRMRYYLDDEGCLDIQFCQSGQKFISRDRKDLSEFAKTLTIEVPRGTVLKGIDLDMVSTSVRIDSVASRELSLDGVFFDVLAQYPVMPEEIDMDGVDGSLNLMVPAEAGMTVEMNGVKKYLNITSERSTRKEGRKTIIGDGSCEIDVDGVNVTLNINEL